MGDFCDVDDPAANLLERRWFAALAKVKALQDECELMREVMVMAERAYRDARMQLAGLEIQCDGLSERLERLEETRKPVPAFTDDMQYRSAGREPAVSAGRELTAA
jgi:predicted  nucleic acid-binding Zn-ribbon protein